jgi:N-ethylmaleimide reductase
METKVSMEGPLIDSKLFSSIQLGPYTLDHRVVMAPMTRMRAEKGMMPGKLMAEYYAQRASTGGLIITEATVASPTGDGYYGAPGIFTDAQAEGWKKVTGAVHKKGGIIFQQLFHVGRQSHTTLQPNRNIPVAPSAVPNDDVVFSPLGWIPTTPARALEIDEIRELVDAFHQAAKRAKMAGFDGVELHGANGYLIDQFLQDGTNKRTDEYGGSIGNRTRFLLEILEGVTDIWGGDKVGVRLSPASTFGSMSDSDPLALFDHAVEQLNRFGLAYLHVVEWILEGSYLEQEGHLSASERLRYIFKSKIIANGGFTRDSAEAMLQKGDADLVAFAKVFISNPDLPLRFRNGYPLTPYDRGTFYGGNEHGYTDYPFYNEPVGIKSLL